MVREGLQRDSQGERCFPGVSARSPLPTSGEEVALECAKAGVLRRQELGRRREGKEIFLLHHRPPGFILSM